MELYSSVAPLSEKWLEIWMSLIIIHVSCSCLKPLFKWFIYTLLIFVLYFSMFISFYYFILSAYLSLYLSNHLFSLFYPLFLIHFISFPIYSSLMVSLCLLLSISYPHLSLSLFSTLLPSEQKADDSLNFEEQILEAAKAIAAATSALVKAAGHAQRELVAQGRVRNIKINIFKVILTVDLHVIICKFLFWFVLTLTT